jgi:hypothetical protein
MSNWPDETGKPVTNPNMVFQTDLEFTDFSPWKPTISDNQYKWNFSLEVPENSDLTAGAVASTNNFRPGFLAQRRVYPDILIEPITIQNLSLSFTLKDPLPKDATIIRIHIQLSDFDVFSQRRLVNYTVISLNNVEDWVTETWTWSANPSDLKIGKTYQFEATLLAIKSELAGPLKAKPGILIHYAHWDHLGIVGLGSAVTVAHPEGPMVTVSAEGFYAWQADVSYHRQDFWFEAVATPPPVPCASFNCHPEISWVSEVVVFNASASSSSYDLTSYAWDFGDGNTTTTAIPTIDHAYGREGRYTVEFNVTDVYGLWNVTSYNVTVTFTADLNRDCTVNILDVFAVAMAFGSKPGDANWNAVADLNKDNVVNILDVFAVANDYGKTV